MNDVFNIISNGKDYITPDDFKNFIVLLKVDIPDDAINEEFNSIDTDKDLKISITEFNKYIGLDEVNDSDLKAIVDNKDKLDIYYDALRINPLQNLTTQKYKQLILEMIGDTLDSIKALWSILKYY